MKLPHLLLALALAASGFAQQAGVSKSVAPATLNEITGDLVFPSGRSLTVNGTLTGTPSGGTLNLSAVSLTPPSNVVTLTGTQTLTNKTLTAPNIGAATGTSLNLSGAATFGGALTVNGTGASTFAGDLMRDGASGSYRTYRVLTSNLGRWAWGADNSAETGANAGSNFLIYSFDDAGNVLRNPVFRIDRASSNVLLAGDFLQSSSVNFNISSAGTNGNVYIKSNGGVLYLNNTAGNGDVRIGNTGTVAYVLGNATSTSTSSGALVVSGGAGFAGRLHTGNGLTTNADNDTHITFVRNGTVSIGPNSAATPSLMVSSALSAAGTLTSTTNTDSGVLQLNLVNSSTGTAASSLFRFNAGTRTATLQAYNDTHATLAGQLRIATSNGDIAVIPSGVLAATFGASGTTLANNATVGGTLTVNGAGTSEFGGLVRITAGGFRSYGSMTLGATYAGMGGGFQTSYDSPTTRIFYGDGTGFDLRFSTRAASTTTDRITFMDTGTVKAPRFWDASASWAASPHKLQFDNPNATTVDLLYSGDGTRGVGVSTYHDGSNSSRISFGYYVPGGSMTENLRVQGRAVLSDSYVEIFGTKASTSTTSGALVVNGGAGVGGSVHINNNLTIGYASTGDSVFKIIRSQGGNEWLQIAGASGGTLGNNQYSIDAVHGANARPVYFRRSADQGSSYTNFLTWDTSNNATFTGAVLSTNATAGIGYTTGAGGTVTQATSRTTGVTINKVTGAITLVSAAGSTAWQSFWVTNSAVGSNDVVVVNQKSGTDKYRIHVTAVGAGSFEVTYATTGGTTTEQPVFAFTVIKGATS